MNNTKYCEYQYSTYMRNRILSLSSELITPDLSNPDEILEVFKSLHKKMKTRKNEECLKMGHLSLNKDDKILKFKNAIIGIHTCSRLCYSNTEMQIFHLTNNFTEENCSFRVCDKKRQCLFWSFLYSTNECFLHFEFDVEQTSQMLADGIHGSRDCLGKLSIL